MKENQLSRYGAIAKVLQELGPTGKVFFAVSNADSGGPYAEFINEFPVDRDGVSRVYSTIQGAIDACTGGRGDVVLVLPRLMAAGATDPTSWAETLIIAASQSNVSLVGIPINRTQGGLPQVKKGSGSTALLTIRAPGCLIKNLGFNGIDATGGGILLDDDASTKSAFGTTIENCHFKNCQGSAAATTGGAIMWSAAGGAWQVRIKDCIFYKNRAGIVMKGTSGSIPQDVVIENCDFTSNVNTTVDADIYVAADGIIGLVIKNCNFATVDVPAYATSPDAARYIKLGAGTKGAIFGCRFACVSDTAGTEYTFGVAGTAAIIPTTVRIAGCFGEITAAPTQQVIHRT